MGAAFLSLSTFEIAVGGGGASFLWLELVWVHAKAHGATYLGGLGFRVSGFRGFGVLGFRGFRVSGFRGFGVLGFWGFGVSGVGSKKTWLSPFKSSLLEDEVEALPLCLFFDQS
jgi:hypothetical protein